TIFALKAAGTEVPIVFITGDPIGEGIVTSLARPQGRFTGLAVLGQNIDGKRIEWLHQALPSVRRVAMIWNPTGRMNLRALEDADAAAVAHGMTISWFAATNAAELDRAMAAIPVGSVDALMVQADPVLGFRRKEILEFASRNRLPGVYFWREFAQEGGLMSFGPNLAAQYHRAATYIDKILKGAKPSELPIEQPTKFELVINRATAKSLGIDIPASVLANANEVIE